MSAEVCFTIRKKNEPGNEATICWFSNFYRLSGFIREHCEVGDNEDFLVSEETLELLYKTLKPIYETLSVYSESQIRYFDDFGYPEELFSKFYSLDFWSSSPQDNPCGWKLIKLYYFVSTFINFYDDNDYYEIICYPE